MELLLCLWMHHRKALNQLSDPHSQCPLAIFLKCKGTRNCTGACEQILVSDSSGRKGRKKLHSNNPQDISSGFCFRLTNFRRINKPSGAPEHHWLYWINRTTAMKLDMARAPQGVSKRFGVEARGSENQAKRRSSQLVKNPSFPSQPAKDTKRLLFFLLKGSRTQNDKQNSSAKILAGGNWRF